MPTELTDADLQAVREASKSLNEFFAEFKNLSLDEKANIIQHIRRPREKPKTWGDSSVAPYYKEAYGKWLIPYLD